LLSKGWRLYAIVLFLSPVSSLYSAGSVHVAKERDWSWYLSEAQYWQDPLSADVSLDAACGRLIDEDLAMHVWHHGDVFHTTTEMLNLDSHAGEVGR
jgi:hypothetical protein